MRTKIIVALLYALAAGAGAATNSNDAAVLAVIVRVRAVCARWATVTRSTPQRHALGHPQYRWLYPRPRWGPGWNSVSRNPGGFTVIGGSNARTVMRSESGYAVQNRAGAGVRLIKTSDGYVTIPTMDVEGHPATRRGRRPHGSIQVRPPRHRGGYKSEPLMVMFIVFVFRGRSEPRMDTDRHG